MIKIVLIIIKAFQKCGVNIYIYIIKTLGKPYKQNEIVHSKDHLSFVNNLEKELASISLSLFFSLKGLRVFEEFIEGKFLVDTGRVLHTLRSNCLLPSILKLRFARYGYDSPRSRFYMFFYMCDTWFLRNKCYITLPLIRKFLQY